MNFKCIKGNYTCPMNKLNYEKIMNFGREFLNNGINFESIIWSDEKRFTLDGSDGNRHLWVTKDMDKNNYSFWHRQCAGKSLMVWGIFCAQGVGTLVECSQKLTANVYQNMLQNYLLSYIEGFKPLEVMFQQDNSPPHQAKATKLWIAEHSILVLE